ncbi:hypothetical protein MKW98_016130, partial [Papaver atlanticum]
HVKELIAGGGAGIFGTHWILLQVRLFLILWILLLWELDIAIVRATDHVERPTKEKHIRAIFVVVSATRSRADVAYCTHALSRRLAKTHN